MHADDHLFLAPKSQRHLICTQQASPHLNVSFNDFNTVRAVSVSSAASPCETTLTKIGAALGVANLRYGLFLLDRGSISRVFQTPTRSRATTRQGLPAEHTSGTGRPHGWQTDSSSMRILMLMIVWLRSLMNGEHPGRISSRSLSIESIAHVASYPHSASYSSLTAVRTSSRA